MGMRRRRAKDGNNTENLAEEEQVFEDATTAEVDYKKMLSEILHFKDYFAMKGFFLCLVLGLIPTGYDTISDFAFAADDQNRTVELINATDKFLRVTIMRNGTNYTWTSHDKSLNQKAIRSVTYFCIAIPAVVASVGWILNFNIKRFLRQQQPQTLPYRCVRGGSGLRTLL